MRMRLLWLVVTGVLTLPVTGSACEPILPLFQLLTGSTLAGPLYLTHSFVWLAVAVLVKCTAFLYFERRLPWVHAVGFMLLGNVLSTIPGFLVAAFSSTMGGILVALPIVYILGSLVQRRLLFLDMQSRLRRISAGGIVLGFTGFYLISMILFGLSSVALDGAHYGGYWLAKLAFVTVTAGAGIIISAILEECVIANMARKSRGNPSFFPSVFRANYITLGLVLLVAGLQLLPQRLKNPHFITSWLNSLATMLGLAWSSASAENPSSIIAQDLDALTQPGRSLKCYGVILRHAPSSNSKAKSNANTNSYRARRILR